MLEAVGFDLDYTLLDTGAFARSFFASVQGELGARLGCGEAAASRALEEAYRTLTPAHPRLFDAALRRLGVRDPDLLRELVEGLVARYQAHRPALEAYPGVPAILDHLRGRGLRLFLVTDGCPGAQRHKAAALGLDRWFEVLVFTGELPGDAAKPSPTPFRLALERLGVSPWRAAFVGDNPACDVEGPLALGMTTLGVATGPFAGRAPEPRWGWLGPRPGPKAGRRAGPQGGPAFDLGLGSLQALRSLP